MIAIASPFSLFKGFNIFKSLYELDLFGNFELRINVCIVIQVIFEMLLICISYYKYKTILTAERKASGRKHVDARSYKSFIKTENMDIHYDSAGYKNGIRLHNWI